MAERGLTPKNSGRFGKGNPGKPVGAKSKTTKVLKDAILLAAEQVGFDGKGNDGLVGYLRRVASEDVKAFASLLGRVLPLQLTGADGRTLAQELGELNKIANDAD